MLAVLGEEIAGPKALSVWESRGLPQSHSQFMCILSKFAGNPCRAWHDGGTPLNPFNDVARIAPRNSGDLIRHGSVRQCCSVMRIDNEFTAGAYSFGE
jgi:hypothetical protein